MASFFHTRTLQNLSRMLLPAGDSALDPQSHPIKSTQAESLVSESSFDIHCKECEEWQMKLPLSNDVGSYVDSSSF